MIPEGFITIPEARVIMEGAYFGPELEHFVFDGVRYDQGTNYGVYDIKSHEANWDAGEGNGQSLGHKLRPKAGYFPIPPADTLQDARTEMVLLLEKLGIPVEAHHHEVATGGQGEIDMRFTTLTRMADNVMIYKYVVKSVAWKRGMTATFMPKPLFGDNGSGMHVHQSIWKGKKPIFAGDGYAGLRHLRADRELLPPARTRLRGAGQSRLFAAQSLRGLPHPYVLSRPQDQTRRVSLPGSSRQSLSRLCRDAYGRPGWYRTSHQAWRSDRHESL
jgi:Glutamine synthetase, catalytic domain